MRQHPWALEFAWHENSKTFARHSISKTTTLEMWGLKQRPVDWRIKGKSTIVKQWTPSTKWGKTVGLRGHFWFQRYVTVLTLLNYGLALVLNALQNRASRKLISLKPLLAKTVSEKLIFFKDKSEHCRHFPIEGISSSTLSSLWRINFETFSTNFNSLLFHSSN